MALAASRQDAGAEPAPGTVDPAIQVGQATGYRTALYLDGLRGAATEPPPGPEALSAEQLAALAATPAGVPFADAEGEGTLVAASLSGTADRDGRFAVLVAAPRRGGTAIPLPRLLVSALLLVFAALAGWIQLAGHPPGGARMRTSLLVAMVPALTAWGSLIHADRLYREAAADTERRDLTRALAVARARGVTAQPDLVYGVTGFHAYRVDDGRVLDASLPGDASRVASLPSPPSSFTTAGTVTIPAGQASYVALRLPEGGFTVAVSVPSAARVAAYARRAVWLGGGLALWLALVAAAVWSRRPRAAE